MKIRDGLVLRTVGSDHVIVAEGLDALDLRCMVQVNDAVALLWNKAKETGEFTAEDLVKAMGLSEGQVQRIAIARGLLQSGQVMLFDEISSALDIDTERELLLKLFRMYDKTLIFVTHRTEVAGICDEVINLWS